jgi:hypothetical protein
MAADIRKKKQETPEADATVTTPLAKAEFKFRTRKVFLGYEEGDNPEIEPTFANHFEMVTVGTDIFLDVGILKPEDLVEAVGKGKGKEPLDLTFYVVHRIVISRDAFDRLKVKIDQVAATLEQIRDAEFRDKDRQRQP